MRKSSNGAFATPGKSNNLAELGGFAYVLPVMAWITQPGPPINADEDELALKLEFAEYLARHPGKVREAAYQVFRHDRDTRGMRYFGRALQAMAWESDPIVQEEIERLRSDIEVPSLHPSEDQVDLEILQAARDAIDPKAKATLYELYLNARGRNTKGTGTTVNVDARKVVNVLSVPQKMTVEQAKQAFVERNAVKTIENARARS